VFFLASSLFGCSNHAALLDTGHLSLRIRFDSRNPLINREFKRAIVFWARVLDLEWHEDSKSTCTIQVVDDPKTLENVLARSDLGTGTISVNPNYDLSAPEWYATAIHEIGHLLGLPHNPSAHSVMFYIDIRGDEVLDASDIATLSSHHRMRAIPLRFGN